MTGPGSFRCLHNLLYWHNANWLGLGPSASSHLAGRRWKNVAHLGRYLAGAPTPPTCDHEFLPPHRRLGERIMLALRLRDGISRAWLEQSMPADDRRRETMQHLLDIGMLERTPDRLRLSSEGLFVADTVIAQLL
jgi:oxygen-independent coproporphyrinogen-3 oxidase